jgi:outer membrane protein OmpA-like peptidoglycan-associated protein
MSENNTISLSWVQLLLGVLVTLIAAAGLSIVIFGWMALPLKTEVIKGNQDLVTIATAAAQRNDAVLGLLAGMEQRLAAVDQGLIVVAGKVDELADDRQRTLEVENAASIFARLTRDGRVALYGIFFDFQAAEINPESDRVLSEIASVLSNNPELRLAVVGHTDNVGTHDLNMTLSRQRADEVVAALTSRYQISGDRLLGAGAGFLVPVASNETEVGRSLNRRVELVRVVN